MQIISKGLESWGFTKAVPLKKLQEVGFLEKNKLIVRVQVEVFEVVDEGHVTGKETLDVRCFQVLYSQVYLIIRRLLAVFFFFFFSCSLNTNYLFILWTGFSRKSSFH